MQAKQTILDLWHRAVTQGVAVTFINTYGWSTAQARFEETQDAFGREDDVRIVKSCEQLVNDMPKNVVAAFWPAMHPILMIAEFVLEDDYPHSRRVALSTRDPNINMYSEKVTEDMMSDAEPCEDAYNYANLKDTLDES